MKISNKTHMKRILTIILLVSLSVGASGNVAPPQAFISEIYIDNTGNWTMEVGFRIYCQWGIDSMRLVTSNGSSLIILGPKFGCQGNIVNFDSVSVITNANLENPLNIIGSGDLIKLLSFSTYFVACDSVIFGDYPNSTLPCIRAGESISFVSFIQSARYSGNCSIDVSPTIGNCNDTTGALGTWSGFAYDTSGNPFTEGWIPIPGTINLVLHIHSDGFFSERLYARNYQFDTIEMNSPSWPYSETYYKVEPVDLCLRPDSVCIHDIVATGLIAGINDPPAGFEGSVVVSPNPFTSTAYFYFNLSIFDPSDNIIFSILGQDGKTFIRTVFSKDQSSFHWIPSENLANGIYLYTLERNGQRVKSGKIIKL
jgi:hypothetical protein